ncbi:hypothetical protein [Senegalimassilia anaerobia]|uniref:hypothetical protein n=1 Tax=Senegalimassilia anaerobia TaxID=1473216 RepID=UPI0023F5458A|nr:hypothetical protein [Senegalimassilia anaerobia]
MTVLIAFIITAILSYALAPFACKHAGYLYLGTAMLVGVMVAGTSFGIFGSLQGLFLTLFRKGVLSACLFFVVMFMGAIDHNGRIYRKMHASRGCFAICACMLASGHIFSYLPLYASSILQGGIKPLVAAGIIAALILTAMMIVLWITSIKRVRLALDQRTWTRIQSLSYVFIVLVVIHANLMLGPAMIRGSEIASFEVVSYIVLLVVYLVMKARIIKKEASLRIKQ